MLSVQTLVHRSTFTAVLSMLPGIIKYTSVIPIVIIFSAILFKSEKVFDAMEINPVLMEIITMRVSAVYAVMCNNFSLLGNLLIIANLLLISILTGTQMHCW